jgi:hypothetical protein
LKGTETFLEELSLKGLYVNRKKTQSIIISDGTHKPGAYTKLKFNLELERLGLEPVLD